MDRSFGDALRLCLDRIPRGTVVPCGDVARALGDIRAAKAVALWIRDHPEMRGGHRVVRADRTPVLPHVEGSLRADGVRLRDGRVPASRIRDSPTTIPILRLLREEQERLASRVVEEDGFRDVRFVAGTDVAYAGDRSYAAAVVWDVRRREVVETAEIATSVEFPYVPTYLAAREFPPTQAVLAGLDTRPDVLLVDGHGRLHPVLFGFACYAGVALGLPAIGVGKHALAGTPLKPHGDGSGTPIALAGATRGIAWVPPGATRPLYVSVGHRVSLRSALRLVQDVTIARMPEPLRLADRLARKRKDAIKGKRGSGS